MKQITEKTEEAYFIERIPNKCSIQMMQLIYILVKAQPGVQSHHSTREKQLPSSKVSEYLVISLN